MRKINGVPFHAHIDLASLTGGEVIKWSGTGMAWEDQDASSYVPFYPWYGDRGVFGGKMNIMDYITISSTGNATDFGDLTDGREILSACSNSSRGVFGGGDGAAYTIDYITFATTGNAQDFGDLTVDRYNLSACSDATKGVFGGGSVPSSGHAETDTIDYITIATTGNAIDFGNLSAGTGDTGSCSDATRGLFSRNSNNTSIEYITISTTGNALDFGDLTYQRGAAVALSDRTRGGWASGTSYNNLIDYVTIQTLGNALDFGDLTVGRYYLGACANGTIGVFGGSGTTIDYITIQTTGNATDFGDLTVGRGSIAATSGD